MKEPFRFDFAISYASEEEGLAKDLCSLLQDKGAKVFFAKDWKVYFWGKNLNLELPYIFGPDTKFAVLVISQNYIQKKWPIYEFNIANNEGGKRSYEFILPVRIDNVELKGFEEEKFYIDLRKEGIISTVDLMIAKLKDIYPTKEITVPKVWVTTLGIVIEDLLQNYHLEHYVSRDYVHLCDWLEEDLMEHFSKLPLDEFKFLEDSRDGETLSVRISFAWNPEKKPLDFGDIKWWQVLQIAEFENV